MDPHASKTSPGFWHGLGTVPRAVDVLRQVPQILAWLLIPLALTLLLDSMVLYYGFGSLHARIRSALPQSSFGVVLDVLAVLVLLFILAWTFSFVFLTLCELVVDQVSEAVEQHVTGQPGSAAGLHSMLRGLSFSLLQAFVAAALGLGGALLNLIPIIGSIFSMLLASVLLGYGFFSVSAGRKLHSLSDRLALLRAHLWPVLGLGATVFVVNLIPIINVLAMPVFVVAGTLLFLDVTLPPPASPAAPAGGNASPASPG